jgi:hypothetical protein
VKFHRPFLSVQANAESERQIGHSSSFALFKRNIMQLGCLLVFVVTANKIHARLFVPALRRAIKNHQRADQLLATTGIARIRMKLSAAALCAQPAILPGAQPNDAALFPPRMYNTLIPTLSIYVKSRQGFS